MDPIRVVDYDPAWPQVFASLRDRLWPAIRDLALAIEHVGSTAVPGLAAKPVIDMTIVLPDRERLPELSRRLAALGYEHRGDLGVAGREAFQCTLDLPAHHLYACAENALPLRNHLALRDDLRARAAAAREYGELKKKLARRFPNDIDAYVDGKTDFILSRLAAAGMTESERGPIARVNRLPKEKL